MLSESQTREALKQAERSLSQCRETQKMLTSANKQLVDANKMMLAFMAALLIQKHNGAAVLNKNEVEKNFFNYDVTWDPVIDGSEFFKLTASPRKDVQ
jgi:hypothetical protein